MSKSKNGVRIFTEREGYSERPNSPPCRICEHFIGEGSGVDDFDEGIITGSSCKAFPDGIPRLIFIGHWPHNILPWTKKKGELLFETDRTITLDGIKYKLEWKGELGEVVK